MEKPPHQLVSRIPGTKPVAMTKAEHLTSIFHHVWLLKDLHTQFLEITVTPDIMVAREEKHLHAGIHQALKSREHSHIPFRDEIPIFIPEIPNIPEHIQGYRPVLWD